MWRSGKGRRDEGRYVTFFSEESNKEPVCDVKAAGIKLEDRTALICDQRATGARGWLRFPAYANCCLPPHPSRYRSTPSPEGEGFYCWCFSRCLAAIVNYRSQLHLFPASNYAPVARRCNRRGRAQHDHRGNIQGDGWRLRRSGHAEFSLPRVHAAMSPFGLTQLTFTSQTGSLFLS